MADVKDISCTVAQPRRLTGRPGCALVKKPYSSVTAGERRCQWLTVSTAWRTAAAGPLQGLG